MATMPPAGKLDRTDVIAWRDRLPAFPRIVDEILATLDDPDANLQLLVRHVGRDPVLAARVVAQANMAAVRARSGGKIGDLYTAASLIGLKRLREIALYACLSNFMRGGLPDHYWEHCATAAVCAEQLAGHLGMASDHALVAGLLHDIGQLWLYRFEPDRCRDAARLSSERGVGIEAAERELFGVDHATVGGWLAEAWSLPPAICRAIAFHHEPDKSGSEPLVPLVHVAEVLANALDPTGSGMTRVRELSDRACESLNLKWDADSERLFGRIDAMSRYNANFFRPAA